MKRRIHIPRYDLDSQPHHREDGPPAPAFASAATAIDVHPPTHPDGERVAEPDVIQPEAETAECNPPDASGLSTDRAERSRVGGELDVELTWPRRKRRLGVVAPQPPADAERPAPTSPAGARELRRSAGGAILALTAIALAVLLTPAVDLTAASGLLGLPRLFLYAAAGMALAVTSARSSFPLSDVPTRGTTMGWRTALREPGTRETALGILLAVAVALGNAIRLIRQIDDPLGPVAWAVSMLVVLAMTLLPRARRLGWTPRWPGVATFEREFDRWLGRRRWLALGGLLIVAALLRFAGLGSIPIGLQADEGDQGYWGLLVLRGQAPASWFDSGWYYLNLVYFHLLAASMSVFGASVAGTRTLSAVVGLGFVAAVAWIGCRNFGWRTGLLATALATGGALYLQQSRYIDVSGPTILLWAISVAAFYEAGRGGRPWAFGLAGLTGGLSLYFYPSARLWGVGAVATIAVLWWFEHRGGRWLVLRGAALAAVASLVAVAPFLVHLHQHPDELAARYSETSVLDARNQPRLPYLVPPVSEPELFVLQAERTLGMFDRYEDGVATLPIQRPAMPFPVGALTLAGLAWVTYRAFRDPRFALLVIWFGLGMSGVLLTVETPDFLRAMGALVTFPLLAATVSVELADRFPSIAELVREQVRRSQRPDPRATARRVGGALQLFGSGVLALETYLYFVVYPPIMAPRWEYATQEGLQVADLGQSGPVYGLEAYHFHLDSGWVHFLAQNARIGQLGNPGALLPIEPGEVFAGREVPVPTPAESASFILYDSPNQDPYLGLLQTLYPGGQLTPPDDDRRAYVVPAAALARTRGVTVLDETSSRGVVASFGALPTGRTGPATLTWQGGLRLPAAGAYDVRLQATGPTTLTVDGHVLIQLAGGTGGVTFSAAGGLHFVQLTSKVTSPGDAPHLFLRPVASDASFREPGPSDLYALMNAPWGLLAEVETISAPPRGSSAPPVDAHLDVTVGGSSIDAYLPTDAHTERVWSGQLLAPRDGDYRLGFASEGEVALALDGKPVKAPVVTWSSWAADQPGATIHLAAGAHEVRITFRGAPIIRWSWVPPRSDGRADTAGAWTVVPPTALRPTTPIWNVSPRSRLGPSAPVRGLDELLEVVLHGLHLLTVGRPVAVLQRGLGALVVILGRTGQRRNVHCSTNGPGGRGSRSGRRGGTGGRSGRCGRR